MFVRQMSTNILVNEPGFVLSHGGSLAGYTTTVSLLLYHGSNAMWPC